ncbi:MAG: colanic acid biosynthesis glycosyl transferase WcaI [Planctomycetota bacterium]
MSEGHEVSVLCSRGRYLEGRGEAPAFEIRNGVTIKRLRATSFGKGNHLGRLVDYFSFHVLASARLAFSRWADVVVTLTTPPMIGVCGRIARTFSGAKHVNFLMDLHPDAEFECGMINRASLPGRLLEGVAGSILRKAHMNVVLGKYQSKRVSERGVAPERIVEIPVWSDGDEIVPVSHSDNHLRSSLGWDERFVVMYSGNAGIVHGFDEVLDAATQLDQTHPEVLFVFVGGGPRKAEIENTVRTTKLQNVDFLPYFDRNELRYSLSAADVHFMSLLPQHVGVAVPGKLYGILAAGRPVLFVGSPECETAETIVAANAGAVFAAGQGSELAQEIIALTANATLLEKQGRNGRAYFMQHHEKGVCVEAWRNLLESIDGVSQSRLSSEDSTTVRTVPARADHVDGIVAALPADSQSRVERDVQSRIG